MLFSGCFECLADIRCPKMTRFLYVAAFHRYTQRPTAPSKSIETAATTLLYFQKRVTAWHMLSQTLLEKSEHRMQEAAVARQA